MRAATGVHDHIVETPKKSSKVELERFDLAVEDFRK